MKKKQINGGAGEILRCFFYIFRAKYIPYYAREFIYQGGNWHERMDNKRF